MKNLMLTFLVLCQFQFLAGQDLKIATLNCEFLNKKKVHIKFGLPFDLKKQSDSVKVFWANPNNRDSMFLVATKAVAQQIKLINADIIGLTEVGNENEIQMLVDALSEIGIEYPHSQTCKSLDRITGQFVAILSKFKLKKVETFIPGRGLYFTESDKDETAETGLSKAMKVTVRIKGQDIHIFLLHLKSERGNDESDRQRVKQAEIIRNVTRPYLQKKEHVIIMGDFNSEKRHEVLLTLRGFTDSFDELIQTGDSKYFKDFSNRWTYEFKGNREQIDHILLSLPLTKLFRSNRTAKFGIETNIIVTDNELVSDHNAIVISLIFR